MSGPLAASVSSAIHHGLGDHWAAVADDYVRLFARQSYMTPVAWANWMDYHTMRYAVGGKQFLLAQYPERKAA
jgi:hypothetical protein